MDSRVFFFNVKTGQVVFAGIDNSFDGYNFTVVRQGDVLAPTVVAEPSSLALAGAALVPALMLSRKQRRSTDQ